MLTIALQSGSSGNCIYVEAGDTRLLFDAGITGRQAEQRLAAHGRNIRDCDALLLSHDHSDHTACAGVFHRLYGVPLHMTKPVYRAIKRQMGNVRPPTWFTPGDCIQVNDVRIFTIPTPHDGIDTVCFVVEHAGRRVGIFTDLGSPFLALGEALASCNGAYLESNYDPDMLATGSYPDVLKRRISGNGGHIHNGESAALVSGYASAKLDWLVLAHLSGENNTPQLALEAHHGRVPAQLPVLVASRSGASDALQV